MHLDCKIFKTPKHGHTDEECEDYGANRSSNDDHPETYWFAVADGASESSYSNKWAKILAGGYCDGEFQFSDFNESLSRLSKQWRIDLVFDQLPWYAKQKLDLGAFAALAGLKLTKTNEHTFNAEWEAVGDSCIFHIRDNKIIKSFPIPNVDEFKFSRVLISSNVQQNHEVQVNIQQDTTQASSGDLFLLATDAMACWILRRYNEEPTEVIERLCNLETNHDFCDLVRQERLKPLEEGGYYLRNDDATLIRVSIH
jgi:hypothetical protein